MMRNVNRAFSANTPGAPLPWGVAPGYYECRAFGAKHVPELAAPIFTPVFGLVGETKKDHASHR